jgi:hypothetical protein
LVIITAGRPKYIPTFNKIRLNPYPSISSSESISTKSKSDNLVASLNKEIELK